MSAWIWFDISILQLCNKNLWLNQKSLSESGTNTDGLNQLKAWWLCRLQTKRLPASKQVHSTCRDRAGNRMALAVRGREFSWGCRFEKKRQGPTWDPLHAIIFLRMATCNYLGLYLGNLLQTWTTQFGPCNPLCNRAARFSSASGDTKSQWGKVSADDTGPIMIFLYIFDRYISGKLPKKRLKFLRFVRSPLRDVTEMFIKPKLGRLNLGCSLQQSHVGLSLGMLKTWVLWSFQVHQYHQCQPGSCQQEDLQKCIVHLVQRPLMEQCGYLLGPYPAMETTGWSKLSLIEIKKKRPWSLNVT